MPAISRDEDNTAISRINRAACKLRRNVVCHHSRDFRTGTKKIAEGDEDVSMKYIVETTREHIDVQRSRPCYIALVDVSRHRITQNRQKRFGNLHLYVWIV